MTKTKAQAFDGRSLLAKINGGKSTAKYTSRRAVFRQGDAADSIFYVESGEVKLTVVSKRGKEAVVAILGAGDFLGEACLAGEVRRMATATPLSECVIVRLDKAPAIRALHDDPAFSERFLAYLLSRNIRIQEDLVDQLFNSSEKRLARTLLLLARYGKKDKPQWVLPKISQETLAEMIGTTRSRVNFFMKKFEKLGFIGYDGGLQVNDSLLSVVLHD